MPDGRYLAGIVGRLVELFTDGVPTVASRSTSARTPSRWPTPCAPREETGLPVDVTTIAEAVGSDVTNVVRTAVEEGRLGAAAHILTALPLPGPLRRRLGVHPRPHRRARPSAIDALHGTRFAEQCRDADRDLLPGDQRRRLPRPRPGRDRRGARGPRPERDGYVLFLSRLARRQGRRRPDRRLRAQRRARGQDPRHRRQRAAGRRELRGSPPRRAPPTASASSTTSATPRSRP